MLTIIIIIVIYYCLSVVIDGNEIVYRDYVDISIAVATPKVSCTLMQCNECMSLTIVFYYIQSNINDC